VRSDETPLDVVSSDTHIGPLLREQLRDYCPARHRAAFDEYAAAAVPATDDGAPSPFLAHRNLRTAGHHDVHARLRDMDRDGVACEVVFHGSQNNQPIPFVGSLLGNAAHLSIDPELAPVGMDIYNRWLADACSVEPARHVGLAQLPMWDIEAATAAVESAAAAGLRGVNLPAMRHGVILEYNDRAWEPFWSACATHGMALATHVGAASPARVSGPESLALVSIEDGGYFARRAIWWLIFGGVFERHPTLTLTITESPGDWWTATIDELDSVWLAQSGWNRALREQVPERPSTYALRNVFVGASFMAPFEAQRAVRDGYATQLLWGSDYPHIESTWQYPEDDADEPITRLALRNTFCDVASDAVEAMVGTNAVRVYGLDDAELRRVAARIGAPTTSELRRPIDGVPAAASPTAFRTVGAWT
jgi:predicted TIM-barrel fold metal-dependent hydrolase